MNKETCMIMSKAKVNHTQQKLKSIICKMSLKQNLKKSDKFQKRNRSPKLAAMHLSPEATVWTATSRDNDDEAKGAGRRPPS